MAPGPDLAVFKPACFRELLGVRGAPSGCVASEKLNARTSKAFKEESTENLLSRSIMPPALESLSQLILPLL